MELRRAATTRAKGVVKRGLRPFAPTIRGYIDRADSHLVEATTPKFGAMRARLDALSRDIDELRRLLADPNPPLEFVRNTHIGIGQVRDFALGLSERVHAHQVMLDEIEYRLERLAGSTLDAMAI